MKLLNDYMKKMILSGVILALVACSRENDQAGISYGDAHQTHWDYENPNWQEQGYSECAGLVQSPINIDTARTHKVAMPDINFNYGVFPVRVIDNGHTVQINSDDTSTITYNGESYKLRQFHYHVHSEHQINGESLPMEVHFVHQNDNTGAIVILGVMVKGGGSENAAFGEYLKSFPAVKNEEKVLASIIDPSLMMPISKKYYNYTGSLTTPPCSQGMNWIVFRETVSISDNQLSQFQKVYNHNYRPVQKVGSRIVFESL